MGKKKNKMRKTERSFITGHMQDKQSTLIRRVYINRVTNDYI